MLETLGEINIWGKIVSAAFGFLVWILLVRFLTLMVSGISGTKLEKPWIFVPETSTSKWLFRLHDSNLLHETTGVSSFPSMKHSNAWHLFCLVLIPFVQKNVQQDDKTSHSHHTGPSPRGSAEKRHPIIGENSDDQSLMAAEENNNFDPKKPWNLLVVSLFFFEK